MTTDILTEHPSTLLGDELNHWRFPGPLLRIRCSQHAGGYLVMCDCGLWRAVRWRVDESMTEVEILDRVRRAGPEFLRVARAFCEGHSECWVGPGVN